MNTIFTFSLFKTKRLTSLLIALFAFVAIKAANPVITITGANPFIHQVGTPYTDLGATAIDENGNDITSSIQIIAGSVNENIFGTYKLTYQATDANGKTATAMRTVIVTDKIPPTIITKPGTDSMKFCLNDFHFSEPAVQGTDNYFPTVQVTRSGSVNISKLGTYTITYTASDAVGNTTIYTRVISIIPCRKNIMVVTKPTTIELGAAFNPLDMVTVIDDYFPPSDFINGLNGCSLQVSGNVDVNVEGIYSLIYVATNGVGHVSEPHMRLIQVKKSTGTTGIEIAKTNPVKIYPNPNNGVFEIEAEITPDTDIKITNIAGQVVKTLAPEYFITGKAAINLAGIEAGVYFVQLQNDTGTETYKFVIAR